MKIYATSKEDIFRRQQENEDWFRKEHSAYEEELSAYHKAEKEQSDIIENAVYKIISQYVEPLNLDIDVRTDYNENERYKLWVGRSQRDMFNGSTSITWHYEVGFDEDGNIVKETGSYSGLKSGTPEQMNDLKLSVECLEALNNINWTELLNSVIPPVREDYIKTKSPDREYENTKRQLDMELQLADIEELIGTNTLVKLKQGKYYKGPVWVKLYSQSEKQYTVAEIGEYLLDERYNDDLSPENLRSYLDDTYRISKNKFFANLVTPMKTMIIA